VQGYVYDAKRRMAELARQVWRDDALSETLEGDEVLLDLPISIYGGG